MTAERKPSSHHPGLLLFGLFCVLLTVPFIWLRIVTPSDGARLSRTGTIFTARGAVVTPYDAGSSVLRSGDVVTAVDGVAVERWMQKLVDPSLTDLVWHPGQNTLYSVIRDGQTLELEIPLTAMPWIPILRDHWSVIAFFIALQILAGYVYWQRPDDPAARAFFLFAFSGSHTYIWAIFLQISDLLVPAGFWIFHLGATGLWMIFWAALVHMTLVFPKPLFRFNHPGRWVVWLYLSPFLIFAIYLAIRWMNAPNMLAWWDTWSAGQTLVASLYSLPGLVLIILQYATSRTQEDRLRIRWVIYGTVISLGLGLGLYFLPSLLGIGALSPNALGLINFPFVITMAIAILRYRLFDLDVIIRRTLLYTVLTVSLGLIYFTAVTLMQNIFTAFSGQQSTFAIVLSTLAIAALFNPMRKRLQDLIDRRFYRQKVDAEMALAEFADIARSETDLSALNESLVRVVQVTMQPEVVVLMLSRMDEKG